MNRSPADLRHDLLAIVRAGISAVNAATLVSCALDRETLAHGLTVVSAGKASAAMADAAAASLGDRIRRGIIVGTHSHELRGFESIVAGHPIPDPNSERAGRRVLELAESTTSDETLLVLISGGASALMVVPADGVTFEDKRAATAQLLRAGADIHALNTVRKHLSAIKGGWLAARTRAACRTLAISDVVGDDASVIASGPTVPDSSTFGDALDVVTRFGGPQAFPPAVVARLERGAARSIPETPKPGDPRLNRATESIIGSRRDAMRGASTAARALGYHVIAIDDAVTGDARTTAPAHVRAVLASASGSARPLCVVSSGETTVRVSGRGKGGRNQEFALAAAMSLWGHGVGLAAGRSVTEPSCALASIGTDGIDGPTDAAGAIVDRSTLERAAALGMAPDRFLSDNNSYAFFDALGDLIRTGATGTNVGDLQAILLA